MKNLKLLLASSLILFSGTTLAHTEVISTKPENNASIAHDENIEVVFSSGIIHKMTRIKLINTDNTKEYGVNYQDR